MVIELVPLWIWHEVTLVDAVVYSVLLQRAEKGRVRVSAAEVARRANLSPPTVRKALRTLTDCGVLRPGREGEWRIAWRMPGAG